MSIDAKDLVIETYPHHSGHGMGVHRSVKGIKITHLPTGLTVTSTNERSQHKNRDIALLELEAKLRNPVDDTQALDAALDLILKASGSGIKNYSMRSTLDGMREAMRQAVRFLAPVNINSNKT